MLPPLPSFFLFSFCPIVCIKTRLTTIVAHIFEHIWVWTNTRLPAWSLFNDTPTMLHFAFHFLQNLHWLWAILQIPMSLIKFIATHLWAFPRASLGNVMTTRKLLIPYLPNILCRTYLFSRLHDWKGSCTVLWFFYFNTIDMIRPLSNKVWTVDDLPTS